MSALFITEHLFTDITKLDKVVKNGGLEKDIKIPIQSQ